MTRPAADEMFRIVPPSPASMWGTQARVSTNAEFRLNLKHHSQEGRSVSRNGIGGKPPALFTSRSMRPNSFIVRRVTSSSCAGSVTSHGTASARDPNRRASSATASISASLRAAHTTWAPISANARAIPRPMPRPAPVTSDTRSVSRNRSRSAMSSRIDQNDPGSQARGFFCCPNPAPRHRVTLAMAARIEVAEGPRAIQEFVLFHDRVYADRGAFWPAFPALEKPFVGGTGPVGEDRRCRAFVAREGIAIVARALAVLDARYQRHWGERLGHVVKFEAMPGSGAAVCAVMDAACEWLAANGTDAARCGMGPLDMPFVIDDYTSLP